MKRKGALRPTTKQAPERKRILQSIHGIQRPLVRALDLRLISIVAVAVTVPPDRGRTAGRRRLVLARKKEPSLQRDRHFSDGSSVRAWESVGERERDGINKRLDKERAFLGSVALIKGTLSVAIYIHLRHETGNFQ